MWRHSIVELLPEIRYRRPSRSASIVRAIRVLPFGHLYILVRYGLRVSVTRHVACNAKSGCRSIVMRDCGKWLCSLDGPENGVPNRIRLHDGMRSVGALLSNVHLKRLLGGW